MFELKPISKEAIPRSLEKVERYRLLNEPEQAESICRDILRAEPENQAAAAALLLSLTDQFGKARVDPNPAREALALLKDEYERAYYDGIICERWARAQLQHAMPGHVVLDWLREAMKLYERAEAVAPVGNEDAVLRWNTCARMVDGDIRLKVRHEDVSSDAGFGDEAPPHLTRPRKPSG